MKIDTRVAAAILCVVLWTVPALSHDAWIAANREGGRNRVGIMAVVGEKFPEGDPIKERGRFVDPSAYFADGRKLALTGDRADSAMLGWVDAGKDVILRAGIRDREIGYDRKIALEYLTEEIGLSKAEAATYMTAGVDSFTETYGRFLKTIVIGREGGSVADTATVFPLELSLRSMERSDSSRLKLRFRLVSEGKPVKGGAIRVVANGKTVIVTSDAGGEAEAEVDSGHTVLLAHIHISKIADDRLKSVWTNLAIYHLTGR